MIPLAGGRRKREEGPQPLVTEGEVNTGAPCVNRTASELHGSKKAHKSWTIRAYKLGEGTIRVKLVSGLEFSGLLG